MEAVKIKDGVYWVGAIDHNIRNFHGYITPQGTTYNAYLVVDEKTALIDTVKVPFSPELISRISSIIEPASIDYLITNHVEMDHSGSASAIMELAKKAEVVATAKGKEFLHAHYHGSNSWNIKTVGAGDTLSLGSRTLHFIPAPMLHWPDTMFTYAVEDLVLFSNDGFGQHIATSQRFFDEISDRDVLGEAQKYYANILMPYSRMVQKKLAEMEALDIE
ncbi:MAG: FprA family A-type flavoprotein, partial [Candidatus Hydrothermarchaeales archaeon]